MASSLGRGRLAAILGRAMTRVHGPLLFLLLLALLGLTRLVAGLRADALLEHENRARALMGELVAASLEVVAHDRPHPGLREPFLSRFPTLEARPELGTELISYADDGDYLYGLAAVIGTSANAAGSHQGFVLRSWPLSFGSSGDLEFQASDDGRLWEGSNCSGRSGTGFGFPPAYPDSDLNRSEAGWTQLAEAVTPHR
jgi:hypothetical protein